MARSTVEQDILATVDKSLEDEGTVDTGVDAGGDGGATDGQTQDTQTDINPVKDAATQATQQGGDKGQAGGGAKPGSDKDTAGKAKPTGTDPATIVPIIDRRTGESIPGGVAGRLYHQRERALAEIDKLVPQVKQLTAEVEAFRVAATSAQQLGLTPQDMGAAYHFIADWKRDPAKALSTLLQDAKAAGINVDGVGGPQLDAAAIKQMIAQELAPVTSRFQANQQTQAAEARAQQETDNFFTKYPDARVHDPELGAIMQNDPNLSPDAAYFMLKMAYQDKGLDWSKSWDQQTVAQPANGGVQVPANGQQAPITPGRGTNAGGTQAELRAVAPADESMADITRRTMRSLGFSGDI